MAIDLPSLLWKKIVGQTPNKSDIEAIDKLHCNNTNSFEKPEEGINESNFAETMCSHFTVTSADGKIVDLIENGENVEVNWENRFEFIRLSDHFKIHEFDLQIDAIRNGISSIVPLRYLQIFNWKEISLLVCGIPHLDVSLLKNNCVYNDCSINDPHIKWFWEILEEMDTSEKSLFLRFVTGNFYFYDFFFFFFFNFSKFFY